MKWRPKGGEPLAVGCNAVLGHAFVAEARRCGEWPRPKTVDGVIEVDDEARVAVALGLARRDGERKGRD